MSLDTKHVSAKQDIVFRDIMKEGISVLRGSMTISLDNGLRIFALIEGGWLLPAVVASYHFLLDSNAFNYLVRMKKGTDDCSTQERQHWTQLMGLTTTVLNPLPRALEGSTGLAPPDKKEFRKRFLESVATLKELTTYAQVIEYGEAEFEWSEELMQSVNKDNETENRFLVEVAPYLVDQPSASKYGEMTDMIFERAKANKISGNSLAFLSSLSCLYSPHSPICRNILKPNVIVDRNTAHNALSDFQHLRLLLGSILISKERGLPAFALCTADKALGAFWCGMSFNNVGRDEKGRMSVDFTISHELFPNISEDERIELADRIRRYQSSLAKNQ